MRNLLLALAACLAIAAPAAADNAFLPINFKVGLEGYFQYKAKVVEVIDGETMELQFKCESGKSFVLKGYATKDLADGDLVRPLGKFKVTKTMKFGGRTLYVVELQKPKPKE